MLRLRDGRTGELTDVLPAGQRQLRILVLRPGDGTGAGGVGLLRAYLTADLLRRAAEVSGLLPGVSDLLPGAAHQPEPARQGDQEAAAHRDQAGQAKAAAEAELRSACDALNIHPPRETFHGPAPAGTPPFDVGVGVGAAARASAPGAQEVTNWARLWISVAGQPPAFGEAPSEATASGPREMLGRGSQPGAVRLRLLQHGYGDPVAGGLQADGDAAQILTRWWSLVAHWARSPSGAMSRRHAEAIRDAFAADLDTMTALGVLGELADDPDVPDGVKFETFAAADRLLGLDLARDIGK
jgi:hypothetical protein